MKNLFLILFLFICMVGITCSNAQTEVLRDKNNVISIEMGMPKGWGSAKNVIITAFNHEAKEVKTFTETINVNKATIIDISEFLPGYYTLKFKVIESDDTIKEVKTRFYKSERISAAKLNFVANCTLKNPNTKRAGLERMCDKPVIYLYPQQTEDIGVKLNFKGNFTKTIPEYQQGWAVKAQPDGIIKNYADGKEYPYLFWEGETYDFNWDKHEGFLVSADSTRQFLEHILPLLGLIPKEYNEFIDFWLPRMTKNSYNLIHFAGKEYEDIAQFDITPQPDAVLRVFMVFEPGNKTALPIAQNFKPFMRKGFTVVEWGGMEISNPIITKR